MTRLLLTIKITGRKLYLIWKQSNVSSPDRCSSSRASCSKKNFKQSRRMHVTSSSASSDNVESMEEGTIQQADESPQDAPEENPEEYVTIRRSTLELTATIITVIIFSLLGGVIITGYSLIKLSNQLNTAVYKDFPSLSRKEGIVPKEVWQWIKAAKADMTLNPQSAHYLLQVSNDGKKLYQAPLSSSPRVPTNDTYLLCICVSSANLLNTRAYFELIVTQHVPWTLGLRTESFDADSNPDTDPDTGIWTIASEEGRIIINDGKPTQTLHIMPTMVGLYLDYAQGQVSFYDSVAERHLHTYLTNFKEKLRFYAAVKVGAEKTQSWFISFV